MPPFVHLHVHTPFSFLDGADTVETLVKRAADLGMKALAITDHDNVSAAVRFQRAAEKEGIHPIQGAEVTLEGGYHLTLLATGPDGYTSLCRLLTHAHRNGERGCPAADKAKLSLFYEGLIALSGCRKGEIPRLILQGHYSTALNAARWYQKVYGRDNFFLELQDHKLPRTAFLNRHLAELAAEIGADVVATNDVHYATRVRFPVHDLLTCVRTQTCLDDIHLERRLNAENDLRSPAAMEATFPHLPQAISNTVRIAERCQPSIPKNRRLFPRFPDLGGETACHMLRRLVYRGARVRYATITGSIKKRLDHELHIICKLGVEDYFLTVWDISRFARQQGIRYAGRGSAADSAVAYCLFLTDVDAIKRNLLFERFLSLERAQRPDIDLDFEAAKRDDVADYVYQRYGENHVASVCTFHTYHARSAIRDFGKALMFSSEEIDRLAKAFPPIPADGIQKALRHYPELRDQNLDFRRYDSLFDFSAKIAGFPRHIGTHLGGLVVSGVPLQHVTPLQSAAKGYLITQFDKDDIEDLGLIKLDLLSLRTLSAVETATRDIRVRKPDFNYRSIPLDDAATYRRLNTGETVGVFQLESPAQRALQARLDADNIEDIVASVALIRPGPIKGNMVEPFVARHHGMEPITYIHPKLKPILDKTYGVVLYQEQVIEIATVIAGFTPGESDRLRKVMTHFRSQNEMDAIGEEFIDKAMDEGCSRDVAQTIFSYIMGYAGYGFCEAHAAAFADTAYKTAYLIQHYPAEFFAAILSHQPMGFYPPNTICLEARRRGIRILPPHINKSKERFAVESGNIRVGLKQVKGLPQKVLDALLTTGQVDGPFQSLHDLVSRNPGLEKDHLINLILCGSLEPLHPHRRRLLWQVDQVLQETRRRFIGDLETVGLKLDPSYPQRPMDDFTPFEKSLHEYATLGLNTATHVMAYFRRQLNRQNVLTTREIKEKGQDEQVRLAGLVIRPHRPPTKSGRTIVFLTLEDEFGMGDVTIFEDVYQHFGKAIFTSPALIVSGKTQWRGKGVSIVASHIEPLSIPASHE